MDIDRSCVPESKAAGQTKNDLEAGGRPCAEKRQRQILRFHRGNRGVGTRRRKKRGERTGGWLVY